MKRLRSSSAAPLTAVALLTRAALAAGLAALGAIAGLTLAALAALRRCRATTLTQRPWQRDEYFRALVQNASDLIAVADAAGRLTYISPSVGTVLGYAPAELMGTSWLDVLHPEDAAQLRPFGASLTAPRELRARHRDGSWRTLEVLCSDLLDEPSISGVVVNARDVSERKAFEEQLRRQAFHDALTGLPNRALFVDRLEHALARRVGNNAAMAVLCLDLDRFKAVNDSFGHSVGDHLLLAVAERLTSCIGGPHTIARLGGDAFAVLLDDPSLALQAEHSAERIIAAFQRLYRVAGHEIALTTSIGLAAGAHARTPANVLRDADLALHHAKARGGDCCVVFKTSMNVQARKRLDLEAELRRALERDEFVMHYQPKIALATGRCAGVEALVRWQSPTRGCVSPAVFIPLAEEKGLIHALGQRVLEEVCRQTRRWNDGRRGTQGLIVSVNLSARQFAQPTLAADVARALRESGVEPGHIQLEITESVAMDDAAAAVATLEHLKALGVQLAIDDFGTGYSSLAYLKRFPIDVLKIDRTFVTGLRPECQDASIIGAVVGLGRALRLQVVAEGVETADEAAQLRALGCDLGQGYYFSRPLSPERADTYVRQACRHAA